MAGVFALALGCLLFGVRGTQDAIANGDTRSISILHMHTKEQITVTFKRNGFYDSEALQKLNWALRDWRVDQPTRMDPRLFDIAWEVHRESGSSQPFHVVSAYRSPGTNSMLRRRSRGVAKHSQHTMGKAMDFYLPDVSPASIRAIGMKLQRGGVGYYPSAYTPFIHLDVGSVRSWPRMTRDQLARLFPDGRTVHLPADGQPLAGYEVAKAEIIARGGTVGGYAVGDLDEGAIMQTSRRSLWATLFGWNEEDESRPATARGRAAQRSQQALAYAPPSASGNSDMYATLSTPVPAADTARFNRRNRPAQADTPAPSATTNAAPDNRIAAAPATSTPAAATPAAPTPPAIRLVNAPFPTARPRDLGPVQIASVQPGPPGERLNWQRGPQSSAPLSASEAPQEPPARVVMAPVPPRRPDQLIQLAGLPTASGPVEASAITATATPATDPVSRRVTVSHPLPPERPRLPGVMTLAAVEPARPVQPLRDERSTPTEAAQPAQSDRRALDNLFAAVATGSVPVSGRVTITKPRRADGAALQGPVEAAPAAALGFTASEPLDTRADRFSGRAVQPLPTNFISR